MIKHIAFDFDGTLADSVDFCLYVFETVFACYLGEKAPAREEVYQSFGMNEPGVLRFFIGKTLPEAELYFYDIHRKMHKEMCPAPFPGCREMLEYLREKNMEISILTGRSETTCQISMEELDMGKYFSAFQYGSPEKNDKAAQLIKIMQEKNLSLDELIYIGDAVSDVEASIRANVKCLCAAWAKTARIAELEKINPGLVFTTVPAMLEHIKTLI